MIKKDENAKSISKLLKVQIRVDACDEAYRQVNVATFQKNLKTLMGHFKGEAPSTSKVATNS
jgi:hypothetical protein